MESLKSLLKLSLLFLCASTMVQSSFAASRFAQIGYGGDPGSRPRRIGLEMDSDEAAQADFIKKYLMKELSSTAEAINATRKGLDLLETLTKQEKEQLQFFQGQPVGILKKTPSLLSKSLPEEFFLKYEDQTFNDENVAEIYKSLGWDKTLDNQVNGYIKASENLKGLYKNTRLLEKLLVDLEEQKKSQPEEEVETIKLLVESLYEKRKAQDDQDEKELEELFLAKKNQSIPGEDPLALPFHFSAETADPLLERKPKPKNKKAVSPAMNDDDSSGVGEYEEGAEEYEEETNNIMALQESFGETILKIKNLKNLKKNLEQTIKGFIFDRKPLPLAQEWLKKTPNIKKDKSYNSNVGFVEGQLESFDSIIKTYSSRLQKTERKINEKENELRSFEKSINELREKRQQIWENLKDAEKSKIARTQEEEAKNKKYEQIRREEEIRRRKQHKEDIFKAFNRPQSPTVPSRSQPESAEPLVSQSFPSAKASKPEPSQSSTVASSQPESAQLPTVAPKSSPQGEESAEVPKPGVSLPSEPSQSSAASQQPVKQEPKAEKAAKKATMHPFPFEAGMSGMAMQRPTPPQKSVSIKKFFDKGFPTTFFKADQRLQEGQEERERLAAEKAKKNKLKYEAEKLGLKPEEINQIIENFPEMLQGIINTEKKRQRAALASEEADKKNKKNLRKKVIL